MSIRRKLVARTAAVVVVVAVIAVVTTPEVGGAAPAVQGFDGTTITVGGIGLQSNFPDADDGAQGRFKAFNDDNELKGVKIEFANYLDDKGDPSTALSAARELVEQDEVFAILPAESTYMPTEYLTQRKVPWFGWGIDATYCSPKPSETVWGFSYNGCLIPPDPKRVPDLGAPLYRYVAERTGKKHPTLAMFANETDSGRRSVGTQASAYAGAGFDVVYVKGLLPPPPVNDVTPYVQDLLTSDDGGPPDAIACLLAVDCIAMWNQLKANNYQGTFQSGLYSDALVKPMAGSVAATQYVPFNENTPAQQKMIEQIKAFNPGAKISSGVAIAYFAADMFISTLKQLKKQGKDITPENVQAQAAKSTFGVKGLWGPVKYPAAFVQTTPQCLSIVASDGTAWSTAEPFQCSNKTYKVQQKYLDAA